MKRSEVAPIFKRNLRKKSPTSTMNYPQPVIYQKTVKENGKQVTKDFFEWTCSDGEQQFIFNNGTPISMPQKLISSKRLSLNTMFMFNGLVCIFKSVKATRDSKVFVPPVIRESCFLEPLAEGYPLQLCAVIIKDEIINLAWCGFDDKGILKKCFYVYQYGQKPALSQVKIVKFNIGDEFRFDGEKFFIHTHFDKPCLCKIG